MRVWQKCIASMPIGDGVYKFESVERAFRGRLSFEFRVTGSERVMLLPGSRWWVSRLREEDSNDARDPESLDSG